MDKDVNKDKDKDKDKRWSRIVIIGNVEEILRKRVIESSRIEYEEGWDPEKILHTICAFANDIENIGGGYIILGVEEEDGMPVFPVKGINKENIDDINRELLALGKLMEPEYVPSMSHSVIDGKDVLLIEVITGDSRPYKCPVSISEDKSCSGRAYYIRRLSDTIHASTDDERRLSEVASLVPFDCRVNHNACMRDIRPSIIGEYLSKIGSQDKGESSGKSLTTLCRDLKILGPSPYDDHPINAGILFFNERPSNFIEYAYVDVVDMPDPTGTGMTEARFDGPLDLQLEGVMESVRRKAITIMTIKDPETPVASRIYSYPPAAIEEAISNALCHRDYTIREPVTVTIRPDRITVLSFPGPDRSISDEDIRVLNMASTGYRNARIGDFLKLRGLAEKRGTGIGTMIRSLKQNGSKMPLFETDAERSFLRVTFFINDHFLKSEDKGNAAPAKVRKSADELRTDVLILLRDRGALSMRELTDALGYSRNAQNVYRIVRDLVSEGRVEYTIPDKISSRNQRIRLKL